MSTKRRDLLCRQLAAFRLHVKFIKEMPRGMNAGGFDQRSVSGGGIIPEGLAAGWMRRCSVRAKKP